MDGIIELLETIRDNGFAVGRLPGTFHIALARQVESTGGIVVSSGITWRQLASHMKTLKFDKDLVRGIQIDPDVLHPRDRERMWYASISIAGVDTPTAFLQADELAVLLKPHGYIIVPTTMMPSSIRAPIPVVEETPKPKRKKK